MTYLSYQLNTIFPKFENRNILFFQNGTSGEGNVEPNPNEFDLKLANLFRKDNIWLFQTFKWDFSKYIPLENMTFIKSVQHILDKNIDFLIAPHTPNAISFHKLFPYIPYISLFHNEPIKDVPFNIKIEKQYYGGLCLAPSKEIAKAWQINTIIPNWDSIHLKKTIEKFYENRFSSKY